MARLNVLMMASSFGTGLMFNLASLSLALKRRGLNTVVISAEKEQTPGLKAKLREHEIKLYECNYIDGMSPWSIYRSAQEINRIIGLEDIDVIHANGVRHVIKVAIARRLCRQKIGIVQSVHAYAHGSGYKGSLFLRTAPKLMKLCADIVTPVSETIGQGLIQAGLPASITIPIHNGIDLEQFDSEMSQEGSNQIQSIIKEISGRPAIIYPAVLVPRKGHRYLLEAATQVLKEYPEAKFIITNDGPLRSQLEKMVSDWGIAGNIIFTGWIGYEDLHLLVSKATIGAFPSLAELLPMGVLDMMAAAKPVVATSVAGIPEMVVDSESGFLIPPRDSRALAERILELIRDSQRTQQMGARGRKIVEEEFAIDGIAAEFERVYELARARASGRNMSKQV